MSARTVRRWVATDGGGVASMRLVEAELPPPGPGEVTVEVRAAGVNPADAKHLSRRQADGGPIGVGYEVAGVVTALGEGARLASGGGAVGDEVVAFRVRGGYADALVVPAADVFARPAALDHPAAANLLLVGATAAELLHVSGVGAGETVVVHGASGAVGVSVLQQARRLGVRVVGTAGERGQDVVRSFGGEPVRHGDGVERRLRALAPPDGYAAAFDCVGTDEAVDASLALVADRDRVVTIAAPDRAGAEGFRAIAGARPDSARFRDAVRPHLLDLAGRGELVVPVARTYRLSEALEALEFLQQGHPGGKLALLP